MVIGSIKRGISILVNPKEEFDKLNTKTLESVVGDYITLLVTVAIVAGISKLIFSISNAVYLDATLDVSIQYSRMINYSIGRSTSLLFFYLFAGTFFVAFLGFLMNLFIHKIKYTSLLKILMYSLTPFLLFSWFMMNPLPLGIWSIFLIVTGISAFKDEKVKYDSIRKRE